MFLCCAVLTTATLLACLSCHVGLCRSSGARLEVLTVTWANYFRRGWQLQEVSNAQQQ